MMHWTARFLGAPWRQAGKGPDGYSCWGLVQAVARTRLGVDMPDVAVASEQSQAAAIIEASRGRGWARVDSPAADCVAIMTAKDGRRHCGWVVEADGRLGILHADGAADRAGEVVFEPIADAARGFAAIEFWGRPC